MKKQIRSNPSNPFDPCSIKVLRVKLTRMRFAGCIFYRFSML